MAGVRAVIHLAALMHSGDPKRLTRVNVEGTRHVIAACRQAGVARLIFMSSIDAQQPITAYGRSKREAEELVRSSGLRWTILRPGPIYGPGDGTILALAGWVRRWPIVPVIGSGRQRLQPVYVEDVAGAVTAALGQEQAVGKTYDVVGPETVPFMQLIQAVETAVQMKRWHVRVPAGCLTAASWFVERLGDRAPLTRDRVRGVCADRIGDAGPAIRELGWRARGLSEGLALSLGGSAP